MFLTILDVFLLVSGCKNVSVGCIYGSNSMYDCIIGRGLYTLTNIHQDVFLPVVKMPCTPSLTFQEGMVCFILNFHITTQQGLMGQYKILCNFKQQLHGRYEMCGLEIE